MEIIIAGCGKVGSALAEELSSPEHNVTVLDENEQLINSAANDYDVYGIVGNCLSVADLREANADKADIFIATTGSDEVNMLSCMMATRMNPDLNCIARVRNPVFAVQQKFMRDELGVNMIINPDYIAANEIAKMLRVPSAIHIENFANGKVELVEVRIQENSVLENVALCDLSKKFKLDILICAVQRGDELVIPRGDFVLRAGDRIHVTASHPETVKLFKTISEDYRERRVKSSVLIGGGKIAYHLAKQLIETGVKVKIIERDEKRCQFLSEQLNKVDISCADGTDHDILEEERVFDADAVVSLTTIDEENMLLSLMAQKNGVRKAITKVSRMGLLSLADSIGLDSTISPKAITVNQILQYIRAKQNATGSGVVTLYRLVEDRLEALEFVVRTPYEFLDVPLKKLKVRDQALIACIVRDNRLIIPRGEDFLQYNDSVIVVTTDTGLDDLSDIFK